MSAFLIKSAGRAFSGAGKLFPPLLLILTVAGCADKSMDRDILLTFERHSYELHSPQEIKDILRSGTDGLKRLDRHLEIVKKRLPYKAMPGGGPSAGLLLGGHNGAVYVMKVFRGSAASAAGLMDGDRVMEVDGVKAGIGELAGRIRNASGFAIKVARRSKGGAAVVNAAVKKDRFTFPIIFGLYDPFTRTAFVRISLFFEGSERVILPGLEALAAAGAETMVLDLRDTAGGMPDSAAAVLNYFAPKAGPVFEIRSRHQGYCRLYMAPGRGKLASLKTAVLVNSGTGKAAEVFAAALKDLNGARIIGAATRGDVSIQKTFKVGRDNKGLKLTIARLFPPSGRDLEGNGQVPDVKVALSPEQAGDIRLAWSTSDETVFLKDPIIRKTLEILGE